MHVKVSEKETCHKKFMFLCLFSLCMCSDVVRPIYIKYLSHFCLFQIYEHDRPCLLILYDTLESQNYGSSIAFSSHSMSMRINMTPQAVRR